MSDKFLSKDIPILGQRIGADHGPSQQVKLTLSATEHTWSLITFNPQGTKVGVAAMGPIESFPIVAMILQRAGINPAPVDESPIPDVS